MEIQTTKYTSHLIFSCINCSVDVYTTEDTFTVENGEIKILSTTTSKKTYFRAGKVMMGDRDGIMREVEIEEQDISQEDELTQNMIKAYWQFYGEEK
jgi:hypothetical protein